jgi:hypothetical protein
MQKILHLRLGARRFTITFRFDSEPRYNDAERKKATFCRNLLPGAIAIQPFLFLKDFNNVKKNPLIISLRTEFSLKKRVSLQKITF